ncbi:flavin reductase family protein [Allopusillimonas soli]|uniref:Flavin reductase family protein n=1 Tax=Allopusillimonas soli TaxID=659016 RepID=A0A853FDF2_9BURK|nr:flavin reductase family protein [Allopusillimonas soli]NYT37967.1 flavin reductase family protein [Allopusillimonas soli]TEA73863.1 flavin reductase family protein [Allopusillimonas soli]
MQISPHTLSAADTYKLLMGTVVPRPVAWISTISASGVPNLAPFSCYTVVSTKPPLLGVNIGRNRHHERKDTAVNILSQQEFVVNVADTSLLKPMHFSAAEHPADVSEIDLLGLDTQPGLEVAAPRLNAAPISMECRLRQVIPFGDLGAEFFVGEIVMLHVRKGLGSDNKIDAAELDPVCRLGGPNYAALGKIITMTPHNALPVSGGVPSHGNQS